MVQFCTCISVTPCIYNNEGKIINKHETNRQSLYPLKYHTFISVKKRHKSCTKLVFLAALRK